MYLIFLFSASRQTFYDKDSRGKILSMVCHLSSENVFDSRKLILWFETMISKNHFPRASYFLSFDDLILSSQLLSALGHFMASFQVSAFYESVSLTCSSNFRVTGNDVRDLRLASPGGHSTQRLISPIGHLRVASLNDHRVSSPSDSEIRVHSPSKFSFVSIIY